MKKIVKMSVHSSKIKTNSTIWRVFSKVYEKREKRILTNFNKKKIVKTTVHSCKIKTNMTFWQVFRIFFRLTNFWSQQIFGFRTLDSLVFLVSWSYDTCPFHIVQVQQGFSKDIYGFRKLKLNRIVLFTTILSFL